MQGRGPGASALQGLRAINLLDDSARLGPHRQIGLSPVTEARGSFPPEKRSGVWTSLVSNIRKCLLCPLGKIHPHPWAAGAFDETTGKALRGQQGRARPRADGV